VKVTNSISGLKEEFVPQDDTVKIYVCGVTPYSECHIGHGMSYVIFDTIRRYLKFRGYKVKYVQNFTDIDDKNIERANELGITVKELADKYIEDYFASMDALNIERADVYPKATEEIPEMIQMVKGLVDKGHAYPTEEGVYFRVQSDPNYGQLSHQSLDSLMAGARIEAGTEKEHPLDFVLWKAAKPGEPWWDSPWGKGRPGWHIECSAMALKYLGNSLDVHGGGQDLIFPHHQNEIAQSECFTGVAPFAKYWLHNGLVQMGEEKMSKSLGNLVTLREALEQFSPDAIRLFILSSHYRSPLTYSDSGLEAAEKGVERLHQAARADGGDRPGASVEINAYRQRFIEAMDDDFNTAQAIACVFDLARDINRAADEGYRVQDHQQQLAELTGVLGLTLEEEQVERPVEPLFPVFASVEEKLRQENQVVLASKLRSSQANLGSFAEAVDQLVDVRTDRRQNGDWATADYIRDSLSELGVSLKDYAGGTVWEVRRGGLGPKPSAD
jgi:cysteinyl-tRNA synthetase